MREGTQAAEATLQKGVKRSEPGVRRGTKEKETAPSSLEDGRMPYNELCTNF